MSKKLDCWKCGCSINDLPLPLSRLTVCQACRTDLHVCTMCRFYTPTTKDKCSKELADEVRDCELANFCEYFKPKPNAYHEPNLAEESAAQSELNALFGTSRESFDESTLRSNSGPSKDERLKELESLFGKNMKP